MTTLNNHDKERSELLSIAKQLKSHDKRALYHAARVTSDEKADSLLKSFSQADTVLSWLFRWFGRATLLATAAYMVTAFWLGGPRLSDYHAVASTVTALCLLVVLYNLREEAQYHVRLLQPIAGTPHCLTAASLLKHRSTTVIRWRDHVLAQRTVLRLMDVQVMQDLWSRVDGQNRARRAEAWLSQYRAQEKAKYAAACQAVHTPNSSV